MNYYQSLIVFYGPFVFSLGLIGYSIYLRILDASFRLELTIGLLPGLLAFYLMFDEGKMQVNMIHAYIGLTGPLFVLIYGKLSAIVLADQNANSWAALACFLLSSWMAACIFGFIGLSNLP